jgi:hypothetical protein
MRGVPVSPSKSAQPRAHSSPRRAPIANGHRAEAVEQPVVCKQMAQHRRDFRLACDLYRFDDHARRML